MKLSVIIPVYNEAHHLPEVIRRVQAVRLPAGVEREVIIVNDGSTDGTAAVLEKLSHEPGLVTCSTGENQGKGAAVRLGIQRATGDIILIQDADLEYNPEDHPRLIQPILTGKAKVVYGSRFRGKIEGMRLANWAANKILKMTTNLLYGARITDEATAYKVFAADLLRGLHLRARRFEICPELTAKVLRQGYTITEVPISYRARTTAEGKKITWRDGFSALWTLIRYRFTP